MRDFLIFFLFWPAVKQNLLVLFLVKNDEAAATLVSPQSCWFFPLLRNLFQTTSAWSFILVGNVRCQDLRGFYLQFILLSTSLRLLRASLLLFLRPLFCFPSKFSDKKVCLWLWENIFKVEEKKGQAWRTQKSTKKTTKIKTSGALMRRKNKPGTAESAALEV